MKRRVKRKGFAVLVTIHETGCVWERAGRHDRPQGASAHRYYQLIEKLGEGGMGLVWKARDTTLGREVAVELLPDAFARDPERLARLEDEARAIAALNHPGIVTLYAIEEADGLRFLAMELVQGRTLANSIPPGGFGTAELIRIALSIAEAVSSAHRRGITHRDIKPGHVILGAEAWPWPKSTCA